MDDNTIPELKKKECVVFAPVDCSKSSMVMIEGVIDTNTNKVRIIDMEPSPIREMLNNWIKGLQD